jgi:hypothetical protein
MDDLPSPAPDGPRARLTETYRQDLMGVARTMKIHAQQLLTKAEAAERMLTEVMSESRPIGVSHEQYMAAWNSRMHDVLHAADRMADIDIPEPPELLTGKHGRIIVMDDLGAGVAVASHTHPMPGDYTQLEAYAMTCPMRPRLAGLAPSPVFKNASGERLGKPNEEPRPDEICVGYVPVTHTGRFQPQKLSHDGKKLSLAAMYGGKLHENLVQSFSQFVGMDVNDAKVQITAETVALVSKMQEDMMTTLGVAPHWDIPDQRVMVVAPGTAGACTDAEREQIERSMADPAMLEPERARLESLGFKAAPVPTSGTTRIADMDVTQRLREIQADREAAEKQTALPAEDWRHNGACPICKTGKVRYDTSYTRLGCEDCGAQPT